MRWFSDLRDFFEREQLKWTSVSGPKQKRILRIVITAMVAIGLCPLLVHYARKFGPGIWGNVHLFDYVVNLIPTVLSILFAFVIDKDLEAHMKKRWRASIILCGFLWSVALWHQQSLTNKQSANQINEAINKAVSYANGHSDQKFAAVDGKVDGIGQSLEATDKSLASDIQSLSTDIQKTSDRLDTSIGKVGKPAPPKVPNLVFSLWEDGMTNFPLDSETLSPDANGNYHIAFLIKNDSSVDAQGIEEWVRICDECSFATEPKGFEKLKGMDDRERHRIILSMNPGVSLLEGNEIEVKPPFSHPDGGRFSVVFKSTCNTCGSVSVSKQFWIIESLYPTLQ